ncbi:hypothetical protein ARMGADRAFT_1067697 [Armillaria gallica]|uniref:Zinc finger PHD-type domain-containing protein n=1 Tax=Armillaria gallica TaxID=47427 RepID=A0A2H3D5T3_ARMGA|nr:hypothetical protein ARMGADRAFT_1067697 [Armillaria gallica]
MKRIGGLLGKKGIETAVVPLEILKAASGAIPIPALGPATDILLSILNLAYQAQQNADKRNEIVTRCVKAHVTISQHLENVKITSDVAKNIQQFERDLKDVRDFVERENRKNRLGLLFYSKSKKEELQRLTTQFEDTLQLFQISTLLSLQEASEHVTTWLQHMDRSIVEHVNFVASLPHTEVAGDSPGVPTVSRNDILSRSHIHSGQSHTYYTAQMQGRCVVMKVFQGGRARLNWQESNAFDRNISNPHLPQLIATSSVNDPVLFSVYDFDVEVSVESFIVSSVRKGLTDTFDCGIRLVHGISTALHYLSEQGVPLANIGADEFHVFWDTNNRAIITMDSPLFDNSRLLSSFTEGTASRSLAVLDSIISTIFHDINHILYADNLDRSGNEDNQIHLQAFQTEVTSTHVGTGANEKQNESLQPSMSTAQQSAAPTVKPRRELVWKAAYGRAGNIRDISQQYQRLLALQSHSGSRQSLRRYRDLSKPQTYHRCKGYSREEVTLTHAAFDSKIVVHASPSVHEVCLVCGEHIAEDLATKLRFKCHCKQLDDGVSANIQCTKCFTWQHEHCSLQLRRDQDDYVCMECQIVNDLPLQEKRHYRTELNNLCIQNGWAMHLDDNFVGPKDDGIWTTYVYVNGLIRGEGNEKSVRASREQASYQALVYFGRA